MNPLSNRTPQAEQETAHDDATVTSPDTSPALAVPVMPAVREVAIQQPMLPALPPPAPLRTGQNTAPVLAVGMKRSAADAGLKADAVPDGKRPKASHATESDPEQRQEAPLETPDPVINRKRNALDARLDEDGLPATKRLRQEEPNSMQDNRHVTMADCEPPLEDQTPAQVTSPDTYFSEIKQAPYQPEKMALDLPFILPNAIDADMQLIRAWLGTPGFDVNASYLEQSNFDLFVDAFEGRLVSLIPNLPDGPLQKSGMHKTPLTLAIENSHFEMIHALLAMPGIIVSPDQAHYLCMLAAKEGDLHLLQLILGRPGFDVNRRVDSSSPYLVLAAKNGHLPIVHALLAVPGIDVNARGREGKTALHVASQNNHSQIAMALVAMPGIDINAITGEFFSFSYPGYTALMMAAEKGNLALVRTLLAMQTIELNRTADADMNRYRFNGYTPLMLAAYQGHLEIVQALLAMPGIDISSDSKYEPHSGDTYN